VPRCYYNENMDGSDCPPDGRFDIPYEPCTPCADTEELARAGGRLMLEHTREGYPRFIWVESKTVRAGWVVGVELKR
jgi:hypothetical protein